MKSICNFIEKSTNSLYEYLKWWGATLIAELVKNLPAVQETPVRFLTQADPQEKG